jgi:hypothetical protein
MLKFFSSRLEPDAIAANLREFVDAEEVDPKSPTLYAGERPFVGEVGSDRFKVRRRPPVYWVLWWLTPGQWFKPVVDGTITKKDDATHIEIVGGTPVWIKVCWALALLGSVGLIALITAFGYPNILANDPARSGSNMLLGIIVLHIVAGLFVALPIIGWLQTRNDLRLILNELKSRLDLRQSPGAPSRI